MKDNWDRLCKVEQDIFQLRIDGVISEELRDIIIACIRMAKVQECKENN